MMYIPEYSEFSHGGYISNNGNLAIIHRDYIIPRELHDKMLLETEEINKRLKDLTANKFSAIVSE